MGRKKYTLTHEKNCPWLGVHFSKLLGKNVENAYMTDLLQAVINSGQEINAIPVYGGWICFASDGIGKFDSMS